MFRYIMCKIDAREGAESLALIFAFVWDISQENERGAPRRRILLSSTVHHSQHIHRDPLNHPIAILEVAGIEKR